MCKAFKYTPLGFVTGSGKHPFNAIAPGAALGSRFLTKRSGREKPLLPEPMDDLRADGHREIR